MTTLEEKIKVMQAALDGKQIELIHNSDKSDNWCVCRNSPPEFKWELFDYRIKEEPKKKIKLYQALTKDDKNQYWQTTILFSTIEKAKEYFYNQNRHTQVIKLLPYTEIEVEID